MRNLFSRRLIPPPSPDQWMTSSRFCCLNSQCPEHGNVGSAGNLTVSHRYGPDRSKRMLRCGPARPASPSRKGTPLFGLHLPAEKALSVLHHIAEGNGVRKTGRLVGVNRETVARYGKKAGAHAAALLHELVAVSLGLAGPAR